MPTTPANILPDQPFERHGDKQNSDFFEDYLLRIYKKRDEDGTTDNIGLMSSIIIQVEPSLAKMLIAEVSLMTLHEYVRSFEHGDYRYHLMRTPQAAPDLLIREPLHENHDEIWVMNHMSPNGIMKPYTRYIGEVFNVEDLDALDKLQREKEFRFMHELPSTRSDNYIHFTTPSIYTQNHIGYRKETSDRPEYELDKEWSFPTEDQQLFKDMKSLQEKLEIAQYLEPYDHLATRVFMHDREHALLEFISQSSYYLWGAFNIGDQNSSTNVTRSTKTEDERLSPAKVFTANNTPYYTNSIDQLPAPTETFVRNFGRRMHHLAVGVKDGIIGEEEDDYKNVDFVVDQLKASEKEFLAHVIGSCEEGLKQIFSKKSEYSWLITEYIQRCYGFEGFFTKENVAALTEAAGKDDMIT